MSELNLEAIQETADMMRGMFRATLFCDPNAESAKHMEVLLQLCNDTVVLVEEHRVALKKIGEYRAALMSLPGGNHSVQLLDGEDGPSQ